MNKETKYSHFYSELMALLSNEDATISSLSNFCALYTKHFNPHWVGFYLYEETRLILGPFQGPVACTNLAMGKGVCGTSFQNKTTINVPNVNDFKGHIACSPKSKSELVVPLLCGKKCFGVFDIDSSDLNHFNEVDEREVEKAIKLLCEIALHNGPLPYG